MLQGGFFLYLMGLSLGLLTFAGETLGRCFGWLINCSTKEEDMDPHHQHVW